MQAIKIYAELLNVGSESRGEPDGKRVLPPPEDGSPEGDNLKFIDAGTNTCSSGELCLLD